MVWLLIIIILRVPDFSNKYIREDKPYNWVEVRNPIPPPAISKDSYPNSCSHTGMRSHHICMYCLQLDKICYFISSVTS